MRPLEFLTEVWSYIAEEGDTVFLAYKTRIGTWRDYPLTYKPGIKADIKKFLKIHSPKENDIYFCPVAFTGRLRRKSLVKPFNLLWSDIDEGNPKIKPTILWESSPGRLQGLWFLRGRLNPEEGELLNKSLTYYMDADKGGWDITQVLRVPGTYNHKYESMPAVRVIEHNSDRILTASQIRRRIGTNNKPSKNDRENFSGSSKLTFDQVFSKHRRKIPPKVKQLLGAKKATKGKRSDIIWYIENALASAGIPPPEIIVLIKGSVWNKYRGRANEDEQLNNELKKIVEKDLEVPRHEEVDEEIEEELTQGLVVESYQDILTNPSVSPGWLVKDYWLKDSHGIVAGEPKSFKSTLAMNLCISVASGKPFLGKHEVHNPGPVVYIQNENAAWIMKDRIGKMSSNMGLIGVVHREDDNIKVEWPPTIPFHMINNQGFLLTDPVHQKLFEEVLKQYKPVLVVLDPLYLMFDGDINSAKDLANTLSWLLECRYKYKTGIMVIHHYNKANGNGHQVRGGQRMLGSTTLHGWIESAWYIQSDNEEEVDEENPSSLVTIDREFRGSGIVPKLDFTITMGEVGSYDYKVEVDSHTPPADRKKPLNDTSNINDDIMAYIRSKKNGSTENQLIKATGYKKEAIREAIDKLCVTSELRRNKGKVEIVR